MYYINVKKSKYIKKLTSFVKIFESSTINTTGTINSSLLKIFSDTDSSRR